MMTWAANYISKLKEGRSVTFRARGKSMHGKISDGQMVHVVPITAEYTPRVGDIVLCRVHGSEFLHMVSALRGDGPKTQFQIANASGHVNGWTSRDKIYGLFVANNGSASARKEDDASSGREEARQPDREGRPYLVAMNCRHKEYVLVTATSPEDAKAQAADASGIAISHLDEFVESMDPGLWDDPQELTENEAKELISTESRRSGDVCSHGDPWKPICDRCG